METAEREPPLTGGTVHAYGALCADMQSGKYHLSTNSLQARTQHSDAGVTNSVSSWPGSLEAQACPAPTLMPP